APCADGAGRGAGTPVNGASLLKRGATCRVDRPAVIGPWSEQTSSGSPPGRRRRDAATVYAPHRSSDERTASEAMLQRRERRSRREIPVPDDARPEPCPLRLRSAVPCTIGTLFGVRHHPGLHPNLSQVQR